MAFLLITIGAIILTVGDVIMKEWVLKSNPWLFVGGMICYMIATAFMAFSFKYKNIAVASLMFVLMNVIMIFAISFFYYHDRYTVKELVGLVLGITAVVMFEI